MAITHSPSYNFLRSLRLHPPAATVNRAHTSTHLSVEAVISVCEQPDASSSCISHGFLSTLGLSAEARPRYAGSAANPSWCKANAHSKADAYNTRLGPCINRQSRIGLIGNRVTILPSGVNSLPCAVFMVLRFHCEHAAKRRGARAQPFISLVVTQRRRQRQFEMQQQKAAMHGCELPLPLLPMKQLLPMKTRLAGGLFFR